MRLGKHRAQALKLAIDQIDQNPGAYTQRSAQKALLSHLIQTHNLQGLKDGRDFNSSLIFLTVEKYAKSILTIARTKTKKSVTSKLESLWREGSKVLEVTYWENLSAIASLQGIQMAKPQGNEIETNEGQAVEEQEYDEHQRPRQSAIKSDIESQDSDSTVDTRQDSEGDESTEPKGKRKGTVLEPRTRKIRLYMRHRDKGVSESEGISTPVEGPPKQIVIADSDQSPRRVKRNKTGPEIYMTLTNIQNQATESTTTNQRLSLNDQIPIWSKKYPANKLSHIHALELTNAVKNIHFDVQQAATIICENLNITGRLPLQWDPNASDQIETWFQRLFGKEWRERMLLLRETRDLTPRLLVEALVSIAVFDALEQDLPWAGPKDLMSQIDPQLIASIDEILREKYGPVVQNTGDEALGFEQLLWTGSAKMLTNESFREQYMQPLAKILALDFYNIIRRQLDALGAQHPETPECGLETTIRALTTAFTGSLALNAKLRSAAEYFEMKHIASGSKTDRTSMLALGNGILQEEVAWAVTPVIEFKWTPDDEVKIASPAIVYSKRASDV